MAICSTRLAASCMLFLNVDFNMSSLLNMFSNQKVSFSISTLPVILAVWKGKQLTGRKSEWWLHVNIICLKRKKNISSIINSTWMKLLHNPNGNHPHSLFKTRPQNWIWEIHEWSVHYFNRIYFGNVFCFLIDFCLDGVLCITMKWLFSLFKFLR